MRECDWCRGTDDALLNKRLDNERTLVMARWFHCVKLSNRVLEEDHPFHAVFAESGSPHLLVSTRDGSEVIPFDGTQSPSDLWSAMEELLEETYEGRVDKSVAAWRRLLDTHDELDVAQVRLQRDFDEEIETRGPRSRKLRRIRKELDEIADERAAAEARRDAGVSLRLEADS